MSRVLVTGGLGFVGRHLVAELRGGGHDVFVADTTHHHEEQYTRCDVSSYRQVERVVGDVEPEYVYHLAAEFGRWNGEDYYDTLWASNVVGTKNVIRMQERHRFRLVFFSSSEVYGDYDGVMTEDVMDGVEVRQLNDYAMTKWVGEMQVMNSAAMHGTESVRVRLFNTYGAGEYYSPYRSVNAVFAYRALRREPYTVYLGHHRTSSYVTDTVRTLARICDAFRPGAVYNIASDEYHDIKTLSDLVLQAAGADESIVEYRQSEPFTPRDKRVDVARAAADLGHAPQVTLADGVERTVAWMRRAYEL